MGLRESYKELVDDLKESGHSRAEIDIVLEHKESIKDISAKFSLRKQIPIDDPYKYEKALKKPLNPEVSDILFRLGFDFNYNVMLDYCRIEGKYIWCLVGSERLDDKWAKSPMASRTAIEVNAGTFQYETSGDNAMTNADAAKKACANQSKDID